jgi:hypothetical protein
LGWRRRFDCAAGFFAATSDWWLKETFIVILNEVKDLASSGAEKMLDASLSLSMTEPNWRE